MRTLDISIDVPETTPDELIHLVRDKAREAAVLVLQQRGELTIREAAEELALSYEGYLELLARAGLPATNNEIDPTVLDLYQQILRSLGE